MGEGDASNGCCVDSDSSWSGSLGEGNEKLACVCFNHACISLSLTGPGGGDVGRGDGGVDLLMIELEIWLLLSVQFFAQRLMRALPW